LDQSERVELFVRGVIGNRPLSSWATQEERNATAPSLKIDSKTVDLVEVPEIIAAQDPRMLEIWVMEPNSHSLQLIYRDLPNKLSFLSCRFRFGPSEKKRSQAKK